ncbi:MAG TPA: efflux transporter outer membrane subunit, partial [Phycisphaerales bacterium]|nr:efflux transporter outer membrane subunit [Phycisphaerales bacterium]
MSKRRYCDVIEIGWRSVLVTMAIAAVGCEVGPNYVTPESTTAPAWTGMSGEISDRPVATMPSGEPADLTEWWKQFNDSQLTRLIETASTGNLTLAAAQTRIRQARAALSIASSGQYPSVDASASYSRNGNGGGSGRDLFRAGFDATWEIDVFGGVRRNVEAAQSDVHSAEYDRDDVLISLVAEVATTYFELRGSQRQLEIAQRNLAAQQQTLKLTQERLEAGFVSALDVANARANVTQTESQIPVYDAQVRTAIYSLSVLTGREPGFLLEELSAASEPPVIPGQIPVGLPSDLLERRPDIRRADADLHSATARIGVAMADQFPKFSLTGSFGFQGDHPSSLATAANRFWSIGPAVSLPLFTGGRIQGNIEEARAETEASLFTYRQSVLTALQDVETSLVNFTREQQRRSALVDSADANRHAVDLSIHLYSAGQTDFLIVLSAQRQLYS